MEPAVLLWRAREIYGTGCGQRPLSLRYMKELCYASLDISASSAFTVSNTIKKASNSILRRL